MQITLNYWTRGNAGHLSQTPGQVIERIYVNVAGTRDALGYFEQRERFENRGHSTYYDRHRQAKGDTLRSETSPIRWEGPEGADIVILSTLLGENWESKDQWALWQALKEKSRGFEYFVSKRPKNQRDKEIAAENKARQEAVYELAL